MMWFDYKATSGIEIHYTDKDGNTQSYKANFAQPADVVKTVAMIANNNNIKEVTCVGLAYDLAPAIQQQLMSTYNKSDVTFVEGE